MSKRVQSAKPVGEPAAFTAVLDRFVRQLPAAPNSAQEKDILTSFLRGAGGLTSSRAIYDAFLRPVVRLLNGTDVQERIFGVPGVDASAKDPDDLTAAELKERNATLLLHFMRAEDKLACPRSLRTRP